MTLFSQKENLIEILTCHVVNCIYLSDPVRERLRVCSQKQKYTPENIHSKVIERFVVIVVVVFVYCSE